MTEPVLAARGTARVLHFDIAVTDRDSIIATEVVEDSDAMDREEPLPRALLSSRSGRRVC